MAASATLGPAKNQCVQLGVWVKVWVQGWVQIRVWVCRCRGVRYGYEVCWYRCVCRCVCR